MAKLTQRDVSKLLDCIGELYTQHELDSFGLRALVLSRKLVPSAYATYNCVNPRKKGGWFATSPAGLDLGISKEEMSFIVGVNPLVTDYQQTRNGAARKISDHMTQARYHETALYREIFRRLDVESQMAFYLPERPPHSVAIALIRDRHDFTERERLVLNLLRPHLFQAYRNAETMMRLRETARHCEQAFEATKRGVIVLDPRGRVRFCSANAREWMRVYFGLQARGSGSSLPEALRGWLRRQQMPNTKGGHIPPPRQPLLAEREGGRLLARLVAGADPGEQVLWLEERPATLSPLPLRELGLTGREAEVLLWVTQGKTSPEIGVILSCHTATVNKHMEHIFAKLGVETRTAAALQATEVLSGSVSGDCVSWVQWGK
jgi:DNA-binding CsgD family transcriptional regulator